MRAKVAKAIRRVARKAGVNVRFRSYNIRPGTQRNRIVPGQPAQPIVGAIVWPELRPAWPTATFELDKTAGRGSYQALKRKFKEIRREG